MKEKTFDIFVWIMTLILVGIIFFMPETLPMHWDYNWQVDGYGSRYYLFMLAFLPVVVYYGMSLLQRIDPRRKNLENRQKTYNIFRYGLTCFFICMDGFFYYLSLHPYANVKFLLLVLLGVVFIGMGNYMPRIPQNYFLGIKTPWTLSNEYVWKKTHRIGGYSWILIGMIMVICALLQVPYTFIIMIVLLLGDVIFMMIYSYLIYRRDNTKNIDSNRK